MTTKTTLSRDTNSFLARLIRDDSDLISDRDDTGAFLIDRDPRYFAPVSIAELYAVCVPSKCLHL